MLLAISIAIFWWVSRTQTSPSAPLLDWTRTASLQVRMLGPLGVLLMVAASPGASRSSGWLRVPLRLLGGVGLVLVLVTMLALQDFRLNTIDDTPGSVAVPVVEDGELLERGWGGHLVKGRPVLLTPSLVENELVLGRLARGIHRASDARALSQGELTQVRFDGRVRGRAVLWGIQRAAAVVWLWSRAAAPVLLSLVLAVTFFGRPPRIVAWFSRGVLAWYAFAIPLVNLGLHVGMVLVRLPDGAAGRPLQLGLDLAMLAAASLAALAGLGFAGPAEGDRPSRRGGGAPAAAALVPVLLLVACGAEPQTEGVPPLTPATEQAPDLTVILVPGLRADLDPGVVAAQAFYAALGREPTARFSAAYAQSTHPFTSLGTILTGRYPSAIPLCSLYEGDAATELPLPWCVHIPEDRYTVPEVLGLYGYRTALFTALMPRAELMGAQFQHWIDVSDLVGAQGTDVTELAARIDAWRALEPDRPSLVVVALPDMMVAWRDGLREAMGLPAHQRHEWLPNRPPPPLGADPAGLYASEAARLGLELGRLVRPAAPSSARPRWTVVTSSNGINLGDLVGDAHAAPLEGVLMEGTLHVPLAIYGPVGQPVRSVDQVVELVDLAPTLLSLAGADPPAGLPGEDLLSLEGEGDPQATAYAEFGDMLALRQGEWMLTFRCFLHGRTSLDPELTERLVAAAAKQGTHGFLLHQVVRDPHQRQNLVDSQWPRFVLLRSSMLAMRRGPGAPPEEAWSPEKLWDLRLSPADGYW